MKTIRNILIFVLVLGLFAVINTLVHEFGHCLTIDAVEGECKSIYVTPGITVWPLAMFGQPYPDQWEKPIAITVYARSAPTEQAGGFASLMGSGSVAGLSLLALFGLYIFRPQSWVRFPLLAQSFMFLDLLFYTILPHWFGLRHFFFIGGDTPEPLNGAIQMGVPESMFIAGTLIYSGLMIVGCVAYIWQSTKEHV